MSTEKKRPGKKRPARRGAAAGVGSGDRKVGDRKAGEPKPVERESVAKTRRAGAAQRKPRAAARSASRPAGGAGTYHHGDLRRALLAATEELIAAAGVEGFTLREVARRAGVSHGAPAHHFGDVRGLLSEFTAESFAQLVSTMRRRRAEAAPGAFDELVATGLGYVEYALTHPARFQLMFRSDRLDWSRPPLADAAQDAFGELVDCMGRVSRDAGAPSALDADKVALAWSIVHGFATLAIDNRGFAERVSGGSTTNALDTLRRLLESSRPAFERRA